MGLEKYKQPDTPYARYYSVFVGNIQRRKTYKITLKTGETEQGVPTCVGWFEKKDPTFIFQVGEDFYRIPFEDLAKAEPVMTWTEIKSP